uniref:EamA domain-containing protein n=1 Tax=Odontella aurita TaxID=265563 RepID=A0A7S4JS68_9STRA|mmetsp:Transcript_52221/g.156740  ORF Transcript_52221/g.156740 Transcript_52221/m.156740 type:complete len:450 (+) Transcript_52221:262-1611(+)
MRTRSYAPFLALPLIAGGAAAFTAPGLIGVPRAHVPQHWTVAPSRLHATRIDDAAVGSKNSPQSIEEEQSVTPEIVVASSAVDAALFAEAEGLAATKMAEEKMSAVESFAWKGVVAILCALWASNFAAAKLIMAEPGIDSSLYAVTRFSVAFLALAPGAVAAARRGAIDWETAKGAMTCGAWVAFGYLGQTLGLLTTTASRSCVICSMHCVFVAVVAEFMRVQRKGAAEGEEISFDTLRLLPAVVAVAGVAIVELTGAAGAPTIGDALSFAQPIGFGLGYLQLEELMRKRPEAALPVSALKLLVVASASFMYFELSPLMRADTVQEGLAALSLRVPDFGAVLSSQVALGGILYTGLITTALALWVESIAFKRVPATDASIILTTEPLFAATAGAVTLGETFGTSDYLGASLIIGACILAVLLEDRNAEDACDPYSPEDCVPTRSTPFVE